MATSPTPLRVLVVGCGNMGASHAQAYQLLDGFESCGIGSSGQNKHVLNETLGGGYPLFSHHAEALASTRPAAFCIPTDPDTTHNFSTTTP